MFNPVGKAVFLDRDGVINQYPGDGQYVTSWKDFYFLPGAKEALSGLKKEGYRLFVISNQAGVAKGIFSKECLEEITRNMLTELSSCNVAIDGVYYCIHHPEENCQCRKPKTGLLDLALAKLKEEGVIPDKTESYFIGDTIRDIETGKAAGVKTILVFSGKEKPENKNHWKVLPDFTADSLSEAAGIILK